MTEMIKQNSSASVIGLFVKLYLVALLIFSMFRVALFSIEIRRVDNSNDIYDIFLAFLMGVRFDIVVSGYILALPYVILAISSFFNNWTDKTIKIIYHFVSILFALSFLVCTIDIPYFKQFFSRFSITAFEWADNPVFVMKMIGEEPSYWLFLLPYIVVVYFTRRAMKRFFEGLAIGNISPNLLNIVGYVLFGGLMFLGIRGRLDEKSPIRIGTAYFSNNPFLNQLGLNPNFTLLRSYLDSQKEENREIRLMDDAEALSNMQKYLGTDSTTLVRKIGFDSIHTKKLNVVLIIMESMSAAWMKRHGSELNNTPFLDSISQTGYYFENAYTAGIHTHNGIFSTLFSYPALFRQQAMKESSIANYGGIFNALKTHGYSTIYFTTHDGQFDNIAGFLRANGCERVVSKSDYPSDKVKTTLGVPDDYMFEHSIPILTEFHNQQKPFIAAFMTASNHKPYYIPDYFKPSPQKELAHQMVEYSDFALKKFLQLASKEAWYKNTLFVFIADHGAPLDGTYEMSMAYNHTPLIFYAPGIIDEPKTFTKMAGQIDVFPTIMGLLQLPYENATLGIDLLRESRPYIYFNADDKYGVMDEDWFLIVRNDGSRNLYKYKALDGLDYAASEGKVVRDMDKYARSNLQAFQIVLKKRFH